jgi:hypothetical protein
MENIYFLLKEPDRESNDIIFDDFMLPEIDNNNLFQDEPNFKELTKIFSYYGIPKNKMVKYEMLQVLALFETDILNRAIVERRRRLWKNIKELKNDSFFSKYIIFDL